MTMCCMLHGLMHASDEAHRHQVAAAPEDPVAILRARLARGEIGIEEYEKTLAVLRGGAAPNAEHGHHI